MSDFALKVRLRCCPAKKVSNKSHKNTFFVVCSTHFSILKIKNVAFLLFTYLGMSISYTLGYLAPNVRLRCNPVKKVSKKLLENTLFGCCSDSFFAT